MDIVSAANSARQCESIEQIVPQEPVRLGRRRFLQNGAFSVAGLAVLSGVELVQAPAAFAQSGGSPVSNLELLSASADPIAGLPIPLQVCRHVYRYLYRFPVGGPQSLPVDLEITYRLNGGTLFPTAVPGGAPADRLQPTLALAPFASPAAAPANPYPVLPSVPPLNGSSFAPSQLLGLSCYRLTQPVDALTLLVYEWCSLYCFAGNFVVITVGDQCLCYAVTGGTSTPPPPQKNVVVDNPQLVQFWGTIQSGTPHSIGGIYYYTYNSQQGAFSTATWNANLDVPLGTQCKVEAFIPGSSQPQNRTAQARYEVSNSGVVGRNVVTISQQLTTSQWVTLGVFPFRAGTFSVRLTDETGEPNASRIVAADAIRWTNP
jgi:hypothetical protein